jgi:hypothetical protein
LARPPAAQDSVKKSGTRSLALLGTALAGLGVVGLRRRAKGERGGRTESAAGPVRASSGLGGDC